MLRSHIIFLQFSTLARSFETLFSIVKGNEIFSTLTMEQQNADGGEWILWFTRIYVILFVVVFAVFAISLLIAIFLSAHKTIGVRTNFGLLTKVKYDL